MYIKNILITLSVIIIILLLFLNFNDIGLLNSSKEKGIIDVTTFPYKAKGDGNHDDTAAIQKAINDLDKGGIVLLPKGTYKISKSLKIKDGITLKGVSSLATIILNKGTGYSIESIGKKRNFDSKMIEDKMRRYQAIEDLTVQGNKKAAGGIKLSYSAEYFEINKVRIVGNINGIGLDLQDSYSGIIRNLHVSQSTNSTGIRLQANNVSSGQLSFINVVVAYSKFGVEIGESYNTSSAKIIDSVSFNDCIFQHNTRVGLRIGSNVRQLNVTSSHFELQNNPGAIGLQINGKSAFGGNINSNWFYENETAIMLDNAEGYSFENINIQNSTNGILKTINTKQLHIGNYIRFTNVKNRILLYQKKKGQ